MQCTGENNWEVFRKLIPSVLHQCSGFVRKFLNFWQKTKTNWDPAWLDWQLLDRDNVSDFEEKKTWCCFILFVWIVVRSNEGKREKKMGCCLISFVWIALFPVAIPMKEQLLGRRPNTITLAKVFFPVDQSTQKTNSKPNMMNTISIPHLCSTLS